MADKICPECGSQIELNEIYCANCGKKVEDINTDTQTPLMQEPKISEGDSTWQSIEPYVKLAGEFSWILYVLSLVSRLFLIIKNGFVTQIQGWFYVVWGLISLALLIYLGKQFILPFSQRCKQKQWYLLVNDVHIIGGYRIPKMLILGIILQIFSYWGASLVLIVALLIIFLGPEKFVWHVRDLNKEV